MSTKQPDETKYRWYMANKDGMVTLCADQADAEQEAKDAQEVWPQMGPHRAVQLVEASQAFTAADMATAAAQGFRDGQAVQAAVAAGWMPIEMAPEGAQVVVCWRDAEDMEHPERFEFDYLEDGCWMKWHEYAEHVEVIGGHGVSYTPPYTGWMPLPPAPSTEGESNE